MSHFGDFMDGVPVKISEKYKKPPKIELPYGVIECPIRAQNIVENVRYCSDFEKNVLSKLKELRSIKETKKNERRHRLQLLKEAKQKKLDAIAAAEDEERLKQLSVSEVSYPSTDEISALSPDEKIEKICDTNVDNAYKEIQESAAEANAPVYTTEEPQPNILQPIQVKANYEGSLLEDPDPLESLKINKRVNRIQYNHNVDTLTFRDFENDTSSPFDNVELKTINDMELLAQVLQSQKESATSCHPQVYVPDQTYVIPNCATQAQMEMSYVPNTYLEQPIQGQSLMYSPQNYPNGYYIQDSDTGNVYVPTNYQYYIPANPYSTEQTYYSNQLSTTSAEASQVPNGSQYAPQPYYYQYQQPAVLYQPPNTSNVQQDENQLVPSQSHVKSRSRSVPDIVQELNEELAKLKMTDRSYNVSPAPKLVPQPSSSVGKKVERKRRKSERLPNPYSKLPPKSQEMCQKIHGMGFPIDRVARICTIIGDNDKKVVECLLIMGEMMDLGFSEAKVSAALVKHGFDKDKALDELVS